MRQKIFKLFLILILLGSTVLGYSYLESRWLKVRNIEIVSSDVPGAFEGMSLVFISDIHHGPYLSLQRVSRLVKRINKLDPGVVLMGGDYVHRDPIYIKPVFNELSKITSKYGVYAVLGNHDHWEDAQLTRSMMNRNGYNICDNKSYWLRIGSDSIKIGGVGDSWEDTQILDSTIFDLADSDYSVLISHNPDYLEEIDTELIDLTLSGHTHGGQVTLFGLWAPILPSSYGQKYRYGLKKDGNRQSYITSGIGTITPPLRFFCRPEIVRFVLKGQE